MPRRTIVLPLFALGSACLALAAGRPGAVEAPQHPTPPQPPLRGQPQDGPWSRDLRSLVLKGDAVSDRGFFAGSAGVPSLARSGGTLYAAFQWFPQSDPESFDQVALARSTDQGRSWTPPRRLIVKDLPSGFQRPFDPTIVVAGDDLLRLYFTSNPKGREGGASGQAIYSACSKDGGDTWTFEPGERLKGSGKSGAYDCAVAKLPGKDGDLWHMITPLPPGARDDLGRPGGGGGYHATSKDGLTFSKAERFEWEGKGQWIGNLMVADGELVFFGSPGPGTDGGKLWRATSKDGLKWSKPTPLDAVGADPAAVRLENGSLLLVFVSPPGKAPPKVDPRPGIPEEDPDGWPSRPSLPRDPDERVPRTPDFPR